MNTKHRILIAKPGLDGHDRGAKVVARGLSDAGFEIVYTGLHQTPDMIVNTAIQEDVDAIGLSILSGSHLIVLPKVAKLLDHREASDIPLFAGGIIPDQDIPILQKAGIRAVFTPGTSIQAIVDWLNKELGS